MGNIFGTTTTPTTAPRPLPPPPLPDRPYIWAIRDPEQLDWKTSKTPEEITRMATAQTQLPVPIGIPSTGLFLGDAKCARNIPRLLELGITAIVNVASPASKHYDLDRDYRCNGITVLRLEAEDEEGYPMLKLHLGTVLHQIQQWREQTPKHRNVLVHCTAGINRSGVLVAALLMELEHCTVLDAVKHIRERRGNCFLWNKSFQQELVCHARKLKLLGDPLPQTPTRFPPGMFDGVAPRRMVKSLF
jgi:protein-tyrosine phosphatase